jgi:hypothetical protein
VLPKHLEPDAIKNGAVDYAYEWGCSNALKIATGEINLFP